MVDCQSPSTAISMTSWCIFINTDAMSLRNGNQKTRRLTERRYAKKAHKVCMGSRPDSVRAETYDFFLKMFWPSRHCNRLLSFEECCFSTLSSVKFEKVLARRCKCELLGQPAVHQRCQYVWRIAMTKIAHVKLQSLELHGSGVLGSNKSRMNNTATS